MALSISGKDLKCRLCREPILRGQIVNTWAEGDRIYVAHQMCINQTNESK